jgi:hypothetical protein
MDAASRDPGYLTVTIDPESIRYVKGSGSVVNPPGTRVEAQKLWVPGNFKLDVPGLDGSRVNRISGFTIRQSKAATRAGETRRPPVEPGPLEIPNLRISMPISVAQSWIDWHEDFVIKGNNDDSREKNGTIVFLSPDRQAELARITFYNAGIFSMELDYVPVDDALITIATAALYCDRIEFQKSK